MNREQLKTILWLRWRLMNNQWRRSGGLGAAIAVIVGFGAILLGALCFGGALAGAFFGLGKASPQTIMWVWFGVTVIFLFLWLIGLLTELQRSESIDLQKLMHLPVALGQMFVINYLVSHFTLSLLLIVPATLGLGLGLVMVRGLAMILLIPLALSMVLMITAWTYCLRGWLATTMTNPRRRRTVIMCITLGFVLLSQGPNLYFNLFQNSALVQSSASVEDRQKQRQARNVATKQMFDHLIAAQNFIPPLWVPVGAGALAEGNPLPALLGTLGCLGLATLGLRRAYRGTVRFYQGNTGGKATANIKAAGEPRIISPSRAKNKKDFLELNIPFAPEQSAALALATFRSLLRAPEVKMAWATSGVSLVIVGAMVLLRAPPQLSEPVKPLIATGVVTFSIFILVQFFANQFGFDRDGFRTFILSPAERRLILLGKNLATLPVAAGFSGLMLVLVTVWLHLPPLAVAATLLQLVTLLLIASLVGNLLSILIPFRIQPGTMKPTKMPGLAMLVMIFCQFLVPVAMLPVFLPPLLELLWHRANWPDFVPVNLLASALLGGVMLSIYWLTLPPLGRLLQRRETKILAVVSVDVE